MAIPGIWRETPCDCGAVAAFCAPMADPGTSTAANKNAAATRNAKPSVREFFVRFAHAVNFFNFFSFVMAWISRRARRERPVRPKRPAFQEARYSEPWPQSKSADSRIRQARRAAYRQATG